MTRPRARKTGGIVIEALESVTDSRPAPAIRTGVRAEQEELAALCCLWARAARATDTTRHGIQQPGEPGFDVGGDARGSAELTGSLEVELYGPDGVQLADTLRIALPPLASIQRDGIFVEVTLGEVSDGTAVLRTTTPGGAFIANASVVDNRSNDPEYIPAQ